MQKSYMASSKKLTPEWILMDASVKPLGRMAAEISRILQGKHKPTFTPYMITGDFVVVVNAANTKVTGTKMTTKQFHRHSGYPGGIKSPTMDQVMAKDPTKVIYHTVKGMLPKNAMGDRLLKRLHVYAGAEHPHQAQFGPKSAQAPKAE
ncbi:MAG: 50S ribosomal protein L13 [Dehalococcoidia bacterium]|nr:50S ribosomal protein L13 [Dehalococcoidia bacterium]